MNEQQKNLAKLTVKLDTVKQSNLIYRELLKSISQSLGPTRFKMGAYLIFMSNLRRRMEEVKRSEAKCQRKESHFAKFYPYIFVLLSIYLLLSPYSYSFISSQSMQYVELLSRAKAQILLLNRKNNFLYRAHHTLLTQNHEYSKGLGDSSMRIIYGELKRSYSNIEGHIS